MSGSPLVLLHDGAGPVPSRLVLGDLRQRHVDRPRQRLQRLERGVDGGGHVGRGEVKAVGHARQVCHDALADQLLDHHVALGLLVLEHLEKDLVTLLVESRYQDNSPPPGNLPPG